MSKYTNNMSRLNKSPAFYYLHPLMAFHWSTSWYIFTNDWWLPEGKYLVNTMWLRDVSWISWMQFHLNVPLNTEPAQNGLCGTTSCKFIWNEMDHVKLIWRFLSWNQDLKRGNSYEQWLTFTNTDSYHLVISSWSTVVSPIEGYVTTVATAGSSHIVVNYNWPHDQMTDWLYE